MRRLLPVALVLVTAAAAACGGGPVDVARPTPGSRPASTGSTPAPPSPTPTPTVTPSGPWSAGNRAVEVPRGAPTTYRRALSADQVPARELIPRHAAVVSAWRLAQPEVAVPQVGIAWSRGPDPFSAEHGFVVWQAFPSRPAWRAVYAFYDPPSTAVLGVRFETGDVTGDGMPDALTFEDLGGSGACGIWRVIASEVGSAREIYRKQTCDGELRISEGDLVLREAVFAPSDAHCCPSRYRTTTLSWDGGTWRVVDKVVQPA